MVAVVHIVAILIRVCMQGTNLVESLLAGAAQIVRYDPDDDDPQFDPYDAELIFKECHIGTDRDKNLELVALAGDEVVGALVSSYTVEDYDGDGQQFIKYSFDVAVKPSHQRGLIGTQLVNTALKDAAQLGDGDMPVLARVWVVNSSMERMLGRLGFSDGDDERHNGGSCHQEKWLT